VEVRGSRNLCDKEGKILHGTSINEPSNTIYNKNILRRFGIWKG
jgi:hypothetical protein